MHEWTIQFAEIDAPAHVRAELAALQPGVAECDLTDMALHDHQLKLALEALDDPSVIQNLEAVKVAVASVLAGLASPALDEQEFWLRRSHILSPVPVAASKL